MKVDKFRGVYFPFSNTYPLKNWIETEQGILVPSSEHAYMANRFEDEEVHSAVAFTRAAKCTNDKPYADAVAAKECAYEYIRVGVPVQYEDPHVKIAMMKRVVRSKLMANRAIAELLIGTGEADIVEGNDWGDEFWGVSSQTQQGANHLGRVYMELRNEQLAEVDENHI